MRKTEERWPRGGVPLGPLGCGKAVRKIGGWRGGGRGLRAVLYLRVSTEEQGTEAQLRACRSYCEAKGWEVSAVVEERRSAWKGPRPEWERLKRELRARRYDCLVVYRIDRLWRRSSEFVLDFAELADKGIALVSIMEGIDASTPLGRALLNVIVALSELERTAIAEATRQRLLALRNLGKRLGRHLGGSREREVRISDEEIYARWRATGSIRGTARALNISHGKVWQVVHHPPLEAVSGLPTPPEAPAPSVSEGDTP